MNSESADRSFHLVISDDPPAHHVGFSGVADFTDFGDLVGLEILDLMRQMPSGKLPAHSPAHLHWAFDEEIDAFYARVLNDSASRQVTANGILRLSESQELVAIDFAAS